jgi:photosystem II stability/assembly factor-like uncharacterized protein
MKKIFILIGTLLLASAILISSKNNRKNPEENEAKEEAGFDFFYAQRSYPYDRIDYAAFQKAAQSSVNQLSGMRTASTASWQYAGPNNIGGRIVDIEMDPTNQNIAYLGAASGGVFKTTDGGTTWSPVFDGQTSLSIGDIAIAPSNTNILYVGTGEANGGSGSLTYDANGVYKSTDGGLTWTNVGLQLTRMTGRMAVHPTNPNIAFAATMGDLYAPTPDRGLYRTADGGLTWTKVLYLTDSTGCIDVVINPVNPNYVFACMSERTRRANAKRYYGVTSGLWRSVDGGLTWNQLTSGLPSTAVSHSRIGVDLCASDPSTVYAMYIDTTYAFGGLFKSTNNGNTWTQTNDSYLTIDNAMATQGYWYGRIKVDPTDADIVYVIGFDMYKTMNGGNSWDSIFYDTHVDHHEIAVHPLNHDFVMNACDGGLHISYDGGTTWIHHDDLPITQFYTCSVDEQNPANLYGGAQDNGCNRTLTGSFYDWTKIVGGDGFCTFADPNDNTYVYGEYQYGNIFRSDDGGFNFNYISFNGLSGQGNWNCPIVFDPQNTQTLFTGYQQVFRTDDRGDNWYSISPDLTTIDPTANLVFGSITSIDVSPLNSDIIYAGTDDGKVWNTLNGGGNWTNITGTLPVRWVTRVTCDPFLSNRAFVTLSGYRYHDNMVHIYMTTNNGTTWQDISGNLPDVPCNDIVTDPSADSLLYLATDIGVYFTRDMGANWNPLGPGMPVLVCTDLQLHNPTHTLVAATYGRGMYKMDLSAALGNEVFNVPSSMFSVYPNPASQYILINVQGAVCKKINIDIRDVQGRKVYQNDIHTPNSGLAKINVSNFSKGIYFVSVLADGKRKVEKVMIE